MKLTTFSRAIAALCFSMIAGAAAADVVVDSSRPGDPIYLQATTCATHRWVATLSATGAVCTQPAAADISGLTAYATAAVGQLPGTATNDNASSGNVGEYVSSAIASPGTSLSTGVASNVTSLNLTAGDWDITCNVLFLTASNTVLAALISEISDTSATAAFTAGEYTQSNYPGFTPGAANTSANAPLVRRSLSAPATKYCIVYSSFTVGTLSAYGLMRARRVR